MTDMTPNQIRHSRINETEDPIIECDNCAIELDDTTEDKRQCDHDDDKHTLCKSCCDETYIPYLERSIAGFRDMNDLD